MTQTPKHRIQEPARRAGNYKPKAPTGTKVLPSDPEPKPKQAATAEPGPRRADSSAKPETAGA